MNESYKSICKYLFELGEKDSNQKKGPSQMYEFLVSRNQHKYSIPSESEMRTLISSLIKSKKKQEEDGDDDNDSNRENNDRFPREYEEFIKEEIEIVIENDELDELFPTALLTAAKDKFESNIQLKIDMLKLKASSKREWQH